MNFDISYSTISGEKEDNDINLAITVLQLCNGESPHLLHNLSVNYYHYGQVIKYVIIMKVCSLIRITMVTKTLKLLNRNLIYH